MLFFLAAFPPFFIWFMNRPLNFQGKERTFVIPLGEDSYQVASRLEETGLIRNRYFFLLSLWQQKLWGKIQAGSFSLSPRMTTAEIAVELINGKRDRWLRIVEGVRREEIAFQVEKELAIPREEFLEASKGKEGRLFPDSYLVPLDVSAPRLVEIINENFRRRTADVRKKAARQKLTAEELLIIASLVEREAREKDDRILVAGILLKRWRSNWPLQVDATVQYAKALSSPSLKGEWWPPLSGRDLSLESPFNTYLHLGLPPSPICNPSLQSLEATVDYRETPFWFYLSDKEGRVHFARSLEEHQENIKKYLK